MSGGRAGRRRDRWDPGTDTGAGRWSRPAWTIPADDEPSGPADDEPSGLARSAGEPADELAARRDRRRALRSEPLPADRHATPDTVDRPPRPVDGYAFGGPRSWSLPPEPATTDEDVDDEDVDEDDVDEDDFDELDEDAYWPMDPPGAFGLRSGEDAAGRGSYPGDRHDGGWDDSGYDQLGFDARAYGDDAYEDWAEIRAAVDQRWGARRPADPGGGTARAGGAPAPGPPATGRARVQRIRPFSAPPGPPGGRDARPDARGDAAERRGTDPLGGRDRRGARRRPDPGDDPLTGDLPRDIGKGRPDDRVTRPPSGRGQWLDDEPLDDRWADDVPRRSAGRRSGADDPPDERWDRRGADDPLDERWDRRGADDPLDERWDRWDEGRPPGGWGPAGDGFNDRDADDRDADDRDADDPLGGRRGAGDDPDDDRLDRRLRLAPIDGGLLDGTRRDESASRTTSPEPPHPRAAEPAARDGVLPRPVPAAEFTARPTPVRPDAGPVVTPRVVSSSGSIKPKVIGTDDGIPAPRVKDGGAPAAGLRIVGTPAAPPTPRVIAAHTPQAAKVIAQAPGPAPRRPVTPPPTLSAATTPPVPPSTRTPATTPPVPPRILTPATGPVPNPTGQAVAPAALAGTLHDSSHPAGRPGVPVTPAGPAGGPSAPRNLSPVWRGGSAPAAATGMPAGPGGAGLPPVAAPAAGVPDDPADSAAHTAVSTGPPAAPEPGSFAHRTPGAAPPGAGPPGAFAARSPGAVPVPVPRGPLTPEDWAAGVALPAWATGTMPAVRPAEGPPADRHSRTAPGNDVLPADGRPADRGSAAARNVVLPARDAPADRDAATGPGKTTRPADGPQAGSGVAATPPTGTQPQAGRTPEGGTGTAGRPEAGARADQTPAAADLPVAGATLENHWTADAEAVEVPTTRVNPGHAIDAQSAAAGADRTSTSVGGAPAPDPDGMRPDSGIDGTGALPGIVITFDLSVPGPEQHEVPAGGPTTEATPDREAEAADEPAVPDLAEIVADIRWRLDVSTLQEVVDDRENLRQVAERLAAPLDVALDTLNKVRVLCLRAEVDRLLGDVDRAAATARLALAHGESGDEPQAVALARAELAQVLRLCGEYGEADVLFDAVVNADVPDSVRSVAHENAGRCCVDQGRYLEAFDHFGRAMRLGDPEDLDLVGRLEVCLDAVHIRVLRDGWGPSPRLRAEILAAAVADRP